MPPGNGMQAREQTPASAVKEEPTATRTIDNKSADNRTKADDFNKGEASITLDGVEYPCSRPPYSGGTLSDETKYEHSMVGGKQEHKQVKTGKRVLTMMFNREKRAGNLVVSIHFDNKTGEYTALDDSGMSSGWAGNSLAGSLKGKLNITSINKIEDYKYLMSGTFEREVKTKRFGNFNFTGQFKDLPVTDMQNPAIEQMLNKQAPEIMKKAKEEIQKEAGKR